MKRRRLGSTELELSVLGLGAWAMGGSGWSSGWGEQDDSDSIATIQRAIELGINWIDTAAVYGLGHSEEVVARALSTVPRAERPLVFTKCGLPWKQKGRIFHSLKADSLEREIEGSLRRLATEAIDLYQIHWPAIPADGPAPELEEGWSTLVRLQERGKIRHVGVSNFDVAQLERVRKIAPPASLQPPYSVVHRGIESEVLPYCQRHGIGVLVYSTMESGLLTGRMTRERIAALPRNDWRRSRGEEFQEPKLSRNLERVETLRLVGGRRSASPGEVAIAFALRHPAVTGAVVGARRPGQIEELIGAADLELTEDEARELAGLASSVPS